MILKTKRIIASILILTLIISLNLINASTKVEENSIKQPKYVFLLIGDGMGIAQKQLAKYYVQQSTGQREYVMAMEKFPVTGVNTTHSSNSLITDSAAAGTALATGTKTNNNIISKLPNGKDLKTIAEAAKEKGMATGIITTTTITHATPAVFASHNISRNNEQEIALDYLDSDVDFFAGGGVSYFLPKSYNENGKDPMGNALYSKRKDEINVLEELKNNNYKVFYGEKSANEFNDYQPKKDEKIFAAFTNSHLPYEIDRINQGKKIPSLAEMTKKAIDKLSLNQNGFFMMVEGGKIDHACHAHDPVAAVNDTLAFDEVVKTAYDFYTKYPEETLIVVTADHETAGLGIGFDQERPLKLEVLKEAKLTTDAFSSYNSKNGSIENFLKDNYGLRDLSKDQQNRLQEAIKKNNYATIAAEIISEKANIDWTTWGHSAVPVITYAIGVGEEEFTGTYDNVDIPNKISEIFGFELGE